jgi:hypothetical protein
MAPRLRPAVGKGGQAWVVCIAVFLFIACKVEDRVIWQADAGAIDAGVSHQRLGSEYPKNTVPNGYTGQVTGTAHAYTVWQGTSPMTAVGPCLSGQVAMGISASADPSCTSAAGDVSGPYNGLTVGAIQGRNVVNTAPSVNDVYSWSGASWTPGPIAVTWASDLAGSTRTNQWVAAISGNAGAGGTVPVSASLLAFTPTLGGPGLIQSQASSDVPTSLLAVQAQGANGSAVTNKTGGVLQVFSGDNQAGAGHAGFLIQGGTSAVPTYGKIQVRSTGIGGVPNDPNVIDMPWAWTSSTQAVTGGTFTPTISQTSSPLIILTGTLTSSLSVVFPNQAGFWLVDVAGLTLGAFTVTFKSGTGASTALTAGVLTSTVQVVMVVTEGANTIRINL